MHFQQNLVTSNAFSAKRKNLYFKNEIFEKVQKKKYGGIKNYFFFQKIFSAKTSARLWYFQLQ
jgi:hypothetical protein